MLEIIGIIVVSWIAFSVLKGFLRAKSIARGQEYGKEARRIALIELKVPQSYYTYLVTTQMESIRMSADVLPEHDAAFKNSSWPRRLALIIYGEFHKDCEQWRYGNPVTEQLFISIGITNEEIANELDRNPSEILYKSA